VTAGYLPHNTKSHAPFNLVCVKVKRDVIAEPESALVLNSERAKRTFLFRIHAHALENGGG
jgi:hypothetical protein